MRTKALFAAIMLVAGATSAQAATVVNGSFEEGTDPNTGPGFVEVPTAGTITGWTVTSGTVDYIGRYWQAQDGSRSVDLAGSSLGTLSQTIADLVAGTTYNVSFWVSKNPDGGAATRTGTSTLGGQTFNFAYGLPSSRANMNWVRQNYSFTATGTSSDLTFSADASAGCCFGPALDNVQIAAVPEPGTWAMMLAGFGLVGGVMRRGRRSVLSFA